MLKEKKKKKPHTIDDDYVHCLRLNLICIKKREKKTEFSKKKKRKEKRI